MGEQEDKLLARVALTAFSDACTIPKLTPSCPYYRCVDERPTCNEECRTILTSLGVDRGARDMVVAEGLVMHGTPIPVEVATGYNPFDATRQMLEDQGLPMAQQSTGTLLLQLRSHAVEPPGMRRRSDDHFYAIWGELAQRGVPVEGVLRAKITTAVANSILRVLKTGMAYRFSEWQKAYKAGQVISGVVDVTYDDWFQDHVAEWFARILETDSQGFLSWKVPPAPLLASMPGHVGDDKGLWMWDRFTRARLEDWSLPSLILEWEYLAGGREPGTVPIRTLNARTVEGDRVAEIVMSRLAGVRWGPEAPPDLSADHFVARAIELLESGRPGDAADIFAALVVVHPADGDAQNNLGFCLLPTDVRTASKVLDRASTLPLNRKALNTANRAFARHLLGDNDGALALLERAREEPDIERAILVWVEGDCGRFSLRHQDSVIAYVAQLTTHIHEVTSRPSGGLNGFGPEGEAPTPQREDRTAAERGANRSAPTEPAP